jgi:hypothetical protein
MTNSGLSVKQLALSGHQRRFRRSLLLGALVCWILAAVTILLLVMEVSFPARIALLILGLFFLVIFSFLLTSSTEWVQPFYMLGIGMCLHFGIRAWLIAEGSNLIYVEPRLSVLGTGIFPILEIALVYAIIGYLFAWWGYKSRIGRILAKHLPRISYNWASPGAVERLTLLWLAGSIASLLLIRFGGGIYVNASLGGDLPALGVAMFISNLRLFGLLGSWILRYRTRYPSLKLRVLCWISLLSELGFALIGGYKFAFFALGCVLVIATTYGAGRAPHWRIVILFVIIGLFAVVYVAAFREVALSYGLFVPPERLSTIVTQAWEQMWYRPAENLFRFAAQEYANRLVLDNFLIILLYTPQTVPYLHGASLLPILYSPIPRILWPDRPTIALTFMDIYQSGPRVGGTAVTMIGDLYRNFGPLGVPIGMFLIGVVLRLVYEWLVIRSGRGVAASVIFGMLFISWLNLAEMGLTDFIYWPLLRQLPLALLAVWFVQWPFSRIKYAVEI